MAEIDTGPLRVTLFEDGLFDLYRMTYRGINLSFLSKNGIFTPSGVDTATSYGEAFPGGMLYTCGLESVGGRPGERTHGRLHSLPMRVERLVPGDGEGEEGLLEEKGLLLLQGSTADTALFGQNLRFTRRVISAIGSSRIRVEDCVRNDGFTPVPICLLYHVNVGYPLLDEGATVTAEVEETVPRTPFARREQAKWRIMEPPADGIPEQVFYHRTKDGIARFENPSLGIALTVRFDPVAMPWLLQWKSRGSGDYALGLEPSTTRLDGDFEKKPLLPGEQRRFFLELEVEELPSLPESAPEKTGENTKSDKKEQNRKKEGKSIQ